VRGRKGLWWGCGGGGGGKRMIDSHQSAFK